MALRVAFASRCMRPPSSPCRPAERRPCSARAQGFDPLLLSNVVPIQWAREAELKHGGGSWTGNGVDEAAPTTPIRMPLPYARKHSIVNNVLSSPVLSPFFAKRPENYQELESDELDEFDNFEPRRNNNGERKSF